MVTIKDVARVAEVSVASVSRVINKDPKVSDKTRTKIQQVMKQLGYRVNENARALVTQKSTTIGVVIPDLTDPFFASLANGVDKVARQQNKQMLLSTCEQSAESECQAINLLLERRCDAIVVHSKLLTDAEIIELTNQVPGLVLIDRYIEAIAERCLWLDNQEGGVIAARHLISLHHQRFACIASSYQIDDPKLRLLGFKQEIQRAGHLLDQELVQYGLPNQQGGETAAQYLLAKQKPFDALFVYNDAMAIGAICTLEDNGFKVPSDISVVGFDDVLLSRYSRPKLTTLSYPIEQMAQHAAQLALSLSANKPSTQQSFKFIPTLVKRESTAPK